MAKKLTEEQIEARLNMYEEAASHLELDVCDTDVEREQADIVVKQIRAMSKKFEETYYVTS